MQLRFKKQVAQLPVPNFDAIVSENVTSDKKRHGELLPNSVRAIVCGPSSCGKTNSVLALLTHPNGIRFENVYVYSKSLNQPKYQFLAKLLSKVKGVGYFRFRDHEQVLSPEQARPNSVFILDDIACEKQDHMRSYFCMGRHKLIDSFYLNQTYARIPKHLIRDNCNFLIIFKQDEMNLKHIYDDHVTTDMSYAKFRDVCASCWAEGKFGFLVIDKDRDVNAGRYRKGFDCFISPTS